jgi:hypothetical protein
MFKRLGATALLFLVAWQPAKGEITRIWLTHRVLVQRDVEFGRAGVSELRVD